MGLWIPRRPILVIPPPVGTPIDWDSPQAQGLVFFLPGAGWTDLIRGREVVNSGISIGVTSKGLAFQYAAGNYATVASNGQGIFDYQSYTISFDLLTPASWGGTTDYRIIWSYDYINHTSPQYAQHFRFTSGSGDTGNATLAWNFNGTIQYIIASAPPTINIWHKFHIVFTSGRQEIWDNGKLVATSALTGSVTYYNQPVWTGKANFATTLAIPAVSNYRFYNKALSSQDILDQNANPNGIYWKPRRKYHISN